jgi:hypothetical protein
MPPFAQFKSPEGCLYDRARIWSFEWGAVSADRDLSGHFGDERYAWKNYVPNSLPVFYAPTFTFSLSRVSRIMRVVARHQRDLLRGLTRTSCLAS